MKKQILYLLLFCINITVSAQKEDTLKRPSYIGENGQTIIICDSLSNHFYIVKETLEPYTGVLYTKTEIYVDTSHIFLGTKEGLSKGYLKENGGYFLQNLCYINKAQKIYVGRFFSSTQKYNHALINYYQGHNEIKIIIYYKKKGKSILKKKEGQKMIKYKFNNQSELFFFIDSISTDELPINLYCEVVKI